MLGRVKDANLCVFIEKRKCLDAKPLPFLPEKGGEVFPFGVLVVMVARQISIILHSEGCDTHMPPRAHTSSYFFPAHFLILSFSQSVEPTDNRCAQINWK